MELKATLEKPYTIEQRRDFVITQNHKLNYILKETTNALEAWGYTADEIAEFEKEHHNLEIDNKIAELELLSISDIREGNKENIQVYTDVINSLKNSKL